MSGVVYQYIEAGWQTHSPVNYAIIGSGNGLSPMRRQAITWTNDN